MMITMMFPSFCCYKKNHTKNVLSLLLSCFYRSYSTTYVITSYKLFFFKKKMSLFLASHLFSITEIIQNLKRIGRKYDFTANYYFFFVVLKDNVVKHTLNAHIRYIYYFFEDSGLFQVINDILKWKHFTNENKTLKAHNIKSSRNHKMLLFVHLYIGCN